MHKIVVNGIELAYLERGHGPETVVFSHSYVVDHRHFDAQIEALESDYRVIAYDHRDHGQSALASTGYSIDDLVDDATALIEALDAGPCHFVGLSTGGFVGLRLALRFPDLLQSLVVMDTSAEPEPMLKRIKYEAMFQTLRIFGFGPLTGTVMGLMFSPSFLANPGRQDEVRFWRERMQASDRHALIRFGRAIFGRNDLTSKLETIRTPTLVIVGADDRPQPPARARRIVAGIPDAELAVIPDAGHLSTVDAPHAVNAVLTRFIGAQISGADEQTASLTTGREVSGLAEHNPGELNHLQSSQRPETDWRNQMSAIKESLEVNKDEIVKNLPAQFHGELEKEIEAAKAASPPSADEELAAIKAEMTANPDYDEAELIAEVEKNAAAHRADPPLSTEELKAAIKEALANVGELTAPDDA